MQQKATRVVGIMMGLLCIVHEAPPVSTDEVSAYLAARPCPATRHSRPTKTSLEQVAREYCNAMAGRHTDKAIDRMVRLALKQKIGSEEVGALPEALLALAKKYPRSKAGRYIFELRLDGGPAEALAVIRGQLFRSHPYTCARVMMRLPRRSEERLYGPGGVLADLKRELGEDKAFLDSLDRRASSSTLPEAVFVRKIIARIRHDRP